MQSAEEFAWDCLDAAEEERLDDLLALIRERDAEVRADERAKALAEIKAKALDHHKIITEGPLVGRILVSHWCDKALLNPPEGEVDE